MSTVRLRATGAAAPAVAWERYAVLAAWPTWAPHLTGADASAPRLATGVSGRVHVLGLLRLPFTVTAADHPSRRWSWVVRLGPLRLALEHGVDPHPRGSRTWLVMHGPTAVLLAYVPIAWVALRRLVAR